MIYQRHLLLFIYILSGKLLTAQPPISLSKHRITLQNQPSFILQTPKDYKIAVAAEGLKRPRFFAVSPDGRLFVTDMYDKTDNKKGRIFILDNWNAKTKKFETISTYLSKLHNPNQVAFTTIQGQHYIYIAETSKLSYYRYTAGDKQPNTAATVIANFPANGLSYKYGGWHLTRSLAFHNNKLYVSIGSSCDACIEKEEIRASIIEMDPDGKNVFYYARGLRNAVGLRWVNDKLWATNMGRDNRGPDKPEEQLIKIEKGSFHGWPYYYQYKQKIIADIDFKNAAKPAWVRLPRISEWSFKAHSAPLGFTYFTNFSDSLLNNSFITALHGSTSVWRQRGNAVVQLLANGSYREIVSGFLQGKTEQQRYGRPCDVIQWDNHSFFISDDKMGVIYYVWKTN